MIKEEVETFFRNARSREDLRHKKRKKLLSLLLKIFIYCGAYSPRTRVVNFEVTKQSCTEQQQQTPYTVSF